jgi:hypothetical protein
MVKKKMSVYHGVLCGGAKEREEGTQTVVQHSPALLITG